MFFCLHYNTTISVVIFYILFACVVLVGKLILSANLLISCEIIIIMELEKAALNMSI